MSAGPVARLLDSIDRRADGRRVAWAWAAFLGFSLLVFPLFDAVNGMPEEVTPLDLRFFYGPSAVEEVLTEFGADGRVAYLRSLLIADLLWPLVYGTTLALSIAWGLGGQRRALVAVPVVAVVLDYAENLLVSASIGAHPGVPGWLAVLASGASGLKWVAAGAATVLGVVGIGAGLLRRRRAAGD